MHLEHLELIPKPVKPQKPTKWVIVPCISNTCTCRVRIVLNSSTDSQSPIKEVPPQEELFVVGVYIPAWDSMRTKERKKRYTVKNKPPISIGGNSGKGFGPRH